MLHFSSLLRPLFCTTLIGVDVDGRVCNLSIVVKKNKHIKEEIHKEFKCINNELPIEAAKLIRSYKRKYPFSFLGAFSKTYNQGLVSTTQKSQIQQFGIKASDNTFITFDGWMCYIQKRAIDENRVRYLKALGLDYLFSPFVVLELLSKPILCKRNCMYILQSRSSISIMVADTQGVSFGGYFSLGNALEVGDDTQDEIGEVNSLLDMKNIEGAIGSSIDELKEIGELEDIDKEVLQEEFLPKEIEIKKQKQEEHSRIEEFRDIARAHNAAETIINCINEFYSNDLYRSDFLEKIVIFDTYGITPQALSHIQNTLLLDVELKRVNLTKILIELMQRENP